MPRGCPRARRRTVRPPRRFRRLRRGCGRRRRPRDERRGGGRRCREGQSRRGHRAHGQLLQRPGARPRSTGRGPRLVPSKSASSPSCRSRSSARPRISCTHRPRLPSAGTYVDSAGAARRCTDAAEQPYTFCGHVHDQVLYFETASGRMSEFRPTPGTAIPVGERRRWLAVVGSVGQPRDRNPAAAYTIFDDARREITFLRVPYDHHAAADKIRRAGLPHALAYRVEAGI